MAFEVSYLASKQREPSPEATSQGGWFVIEGGHPLRGSLRVNGAKNAVLPIMAAALLTPDDCVITNVPDIEDVHTMVEVLRSLGATVEHLDRSSMRICASHIVSLQAPSALVKKMRASFLVMGPLLARFGEAASCPPGGDVIGQRPIDVHLIGLSALGAEVTREGDIYRGRAERLQGTKIFMDYPSHIGTENLLMAACLARGTTVIVNASQEPEVVDLACMLGKMGARIQGAGTSVLEIEGVDGLRGASHEVIPDRIEAGTYAIAAAISQGEVELRNVTCGHLESLIWKLREAGVHLGEGESTLTVATTRPLNGVNVQALPYPGFATDLQAAIGVLLTQARGLSVIHERVYDNRLLYFSELAKMGAEVEVSGQTAIVRGPVRLRGTRVTALDIRSGAALVLAGLAAEGETEIANIYHLDRGYQLLDEKLKSLGAAIYRFPGSAEEVASQPIRSAAP